MMRFNPSAMGTTATLQPVKRTQLDGRIYWTASNCDRGAEITHRLEIAIEKSKRIHALSNNRDSGPSQHPERRTESRASAHAIDRVCEAFAAVVDAKSPFTCSHSRGVAEVAAALATALDLPRDRVQLVRRAALLHDLGKLAVPNAILDKKGELTANEWKVIVQHPQLTREILSRIDSFAELAEIAGAHHEKLDGTGYPQGLTASQLSLEARIIAVADIYQAMTEGRPYRPGMSHLETMKIMSRQTPHKLDSRCVAALDWIYSARPAKKHSFGVYSSQRQNIRQAAAPAAARSRAMA